MKETVDDLLVLVRSRKITAAEFLKRATKKAPKFHNEVTVVEGIRYGSIGEANRHQDLKVLERTGQVRDLQHHVPFKLTVNGESAGRYTADFVYDEWNAYGNCWIRIVEDFKSDPTKTKDYRLRKRLMKLCHGIDIRETRDKA